MSILIRRNPIREMAAMQSAMDRLFEDTWRGFNVESDNVLGIDVHETDEAYTLFSNLPGVSADNIEITLHDGVLTIGAELPKLMIEEGVRVHVAERPYGHYTRTIRLPKAVDSNAVEADYNNGVLVLSLPKTAEAQPRQIPIRNSGMLNAESN